MTKLVEKGNNIDDMPCELEAIYVDGTEYSDEDIKNAAATANSMLDLIKGGNKKAAALKAWFKL